MKQTTDAITIDNILEAFFHMEESERLFDLTADDGTHYWDIIRTSIFLGLHALHGGPFAAPVSVPNRSLKSRVKDTLRPAFNVLRPALEVHRPALNACTRAYLVGRRPEYIFITCQRIRRGSELIDNISDHLFAIKAADSVAMEILNKNAISYRAMALGRETRVPLPAIRLAAAIPYAALISGRMTEIIRKHFGPALDVDGLIKEPLATFFQSRRYYRRLFSRHRPKAVVYYNNGFLQGLCVVAKEMRIPVLELQHGASSVHTIHWSYPPTVPSSHPGLALPSAYLTFSDYWRDNTHFPVAHTISIGNDSLCQAAIAAVENGILIVSAYMYHEVLLRLALDLARICPERAIYYKLHPHQFADKALIVSSCSRHDNIRVLSDDLELDELFALCTHVIGIHSTLLYAALQAGKRVCLFRRSNYFWHDDIFPYVEQFDSALELKEIISDERGRFFGNADSIPMFFQPFDAGRFLRALDEVEEGWRPVSAASSAAGS